MVRCRGIASNWNLVDVRFWLQRPSRRPRWCEPVRCHWHFISAAIAKFGFDDCAQCSARLEALGDASLSDAIDIALPLPLAISDLGTVRDAATSIAHCNGGAASNQQPLALRSASRHSRPRNRPRRGAPTDSDESGPVSKPTKRRCHWHLHWLRE